MAEIKAKLIDESRGSFDLYESKEGHVYAALAGTRELTGSAWGPAADGTGEWFACRWRSATAAVRVADRLAAEEYLTADPVGGR